MPEMYWTLRWPDGEEERCYSPSSVITEWFTPGTTYPLPEFLQRARSALNSASDRVERKYGFACSSAMDQLLRIELRGAQFAQQADAEVTCLSISR
ncbi:MSMEG_0570 family nitrogen starvation response protein [Nitratireductor sp. ZSWI3]|uniref:MSMEG_0570 family nitrogen starvation response protein n=1 Tax=Nitratireductor sp. ZSWI3 TaxID=2966359 RepID=UPI0021501DF9|nr:MSMEG_0570 family nitrogen starvation response protein [Nitratireductor sp. ZSWI3]MCR4265178.1 MSMEG_0570 family nitrogen starvation response protein [Nitratireductor sp. ZSWI3]